MPITMEVKGQAWSSGLSGRELRKDMDKIPGQAHKGFESEKVRKKGLLKVLKKVVGKKKDF